MAKETEIYRYLYKRDKPFVAKMVAFIAAFMSIIVFLDAIGLGFLLAVARLIIFAWQTGLEVDFKEKKLRSIQSFGPLAFGGWQPFPPLKYLSVFKASLSGRVYGAGAASISVTDTVFQVNLVTDRNKTIRLFETKNEQEAFTFALQYAPKLDLSIWNEKRKGSGLTDMTEYSEKANALPGKILRWALVVLVAALLITNIFQVFLACLY